MLVYASGRIARRRTDACNSIIQNQATIGDHLETAPEKPSAVVANIPERQGVTGHNVRYVLLFGLAAVILAFALLLISYFT
jgi:hypothetical protein